MGTESIQSDDLRRAPAEGLTHALVEADLLLVALTPRSWAAMPRAPRVGEAKGSAGAC